MTKTSVVRILTRLGAGGPPQHAVNVNRELRRRGVGSLLVCGSPDAADGDMSYLVDASDRVEHVPEMSRAIAPWKDLIALCRLIALLRRERPLIVHTHTAKAGALGRIAARLAGVPVVVHTFHGNVCNHYFGHVGSAAVQIAERLLAGLTDAVCVLSEQQRRELCDELSVAPADRVRVVPLGFDLDPFRSIAPPPGGPFTVGWFGRLVPVKNIPLLLATIRAAGPGIRFLIAGDGPERHAVEALAAELGPVRCEFLGWRRETGPVLEQCHVLLQTSRNEGTPAALIQGMAAGRPFVSTAAGGVVDLVAGVPCHRSPGARWFDNAVLADSTPEALAAALRGVAADPDGSARMGACAAGFAERFTLDALTGSLDNLYRDLLARKGILPALAPVYREG